MSHIGGGYSNITVVQRVTPALRVAPGSADMKARVFYLSIST